MSMVGQSKSDDIFVSGVNCKELMIAGVINFAFLFLWNVNMWIFSLWVPKILSDLLCPAMLILPHPTLHVNFFSCQGDKA